MTTPPTTVLFDVDGTLVDTTYLHAVAWFRACRQEGHVVPMARLHRRIGMGSERLLDDLLPGRDRDRDDVLKAAHAEHLAAAAGLLERLPGARDLLEAIDQRGARVVLATSAAPVELRALRAALDAENVISAVTSAADADASKPAPDILRAALEAAGSDADHAIMVGDSPWDVLAARHAGLACVTVTCGGTSHDELARAGAAAVYADPADLLAHLDESPIGALLTDRPSPQPAQRS